MKSKFAAALAAIALTTAVSAPALAAPLHSPNPTRACRCLPYAAVKGTVYFYGDSAGLTSKAKSQIRAMVKRLTNKDYIVVQLTGSVMKTGYSKHDQTLAKKRANAVSKYIKSLGITGYFTVNYINKAVSTDPSARSVRVELGYAVG